MEKTRIDYPSKQKLSSDKIIGCNLPILLGSQLRRRGVSQFAEVCRATRQCGGIRGYASLLSQFVRVLSRLSEFCQWWKPLILLVLSPNSDKSTPYGGVLTALPLGAFAVFELRLRRAGEHEMSLSLIYFNLG